MGHCEEMAKDDLEDDLLESPWRKDVEALEMAIKEQEPREDAISRKAVMNCFKKWQPYMATRLFGFEKELSSLPSVTPQPKTGHWNTYELAQGGINEKWLECSECTWSNALLIPRNYCPKCGARMMEKEDDKE